MWFTALICCVVYCLCLVCGGSFLGWVVQVGDLWIGLVWLIVLS